VARVGRLAGAILAETQDQYFLVGNLKEPCKFESHGFETPAELDAMKHRYVRLSALREVSMAGPHLLLDFEGEALARLLAERFLIERNGSVSDRLWRLVTNADDPEEVPQSSDIKCQWLAEIPGEIWQIVRDTVLRCL
jgi:hypothetical protein